MIKLTDEYRVVKTKTKYNNVGDKVDDSLYLVRIDDNNLAIKRGDKVLNYFGCVRTALYRSLNYAIKGSEVALSLESIMSTIKNTDDVIKRLDKDVI